MREDPVWIPPYPCQGAHRIIISLNYLNLWRLLANLFLTPQQFNRLGINTESISKVAFTEVSTCFVLIGNVFNDMGSYVSVQNEA